MSGPANGEKIRVLIVEDHQVLADGLQFTLSRHGDLEVVGCAATVSEGIRLARSSTPDVILLDFHLPDGTAPDLARAVRGELPDCAIVILSADRSDDAFASCVEAGAVGFISKSQAAAQVADAIRRAASGETLIPVARLMGVIQRQQQRAQLERERTHLVAQLTRREREVLTLLGDGLSSREISDRLSVSFTTVRGHLQNIYEKLAVHSQREALAKAGELGLFDRNRLLEDGE